MSAQVEPKQDSNIDPHLPAHSAWASAWKKAGIIAAVGLVLTVLGSMGAHDGGRRFAYAYIYGYFTIATIALGSLFFVLVQRLTSANWSVTVRRTSEFFMSGLPVLAVLALPILANVKHYEWHDIVAPHSSEHGSEHAAPRVGALPGISDALAHEGHHDEDEHQGPADNVPGALGTHDGAPSHGLHPNALSHGAHAQVAEHEAHVGHDPNHVAHLETLAKKAGWFNPTFFFVRAGLYLLAWTWLGLRFFKFSVSQDKDKDVAWTLRAQGAAPTSMMFFALSVTFAAFDWVMALEPSWFSTIFGIIVFSTAVVSSLAVLILVTMSLVDAGHLKGLVNVEHFHDMGKLLFGFIVFWAYVSFSQFMLIWYAGLPEEATYYHLRWDSSGEATAGAGPWSAVSIFLLFGHFVIPFLMLISRNTKRALGTLKMAAAWVLLMHVVDWYWVVMPNFKHYAVELSLADIGTPMLIGGIYFAYVFRKMTQHALIPTGDPRLARSIHFHQV